MKIGFVSDLHLAPRPLNRCTTDPAALLRDLTQILAWADHLIVVGDAYDLLRPKRPRAWRDHLRQIKASFPQLCALLDQCDMVFGNHDEPLKVLGVPEEWAMRQGEWSLLATHGHQGDPLIKRVPFLAEGGNFAAGWFERLDLSSMAMVLEKVPDHLDRLKAKFGPENKTQEDHHDRALELARQKLQSWSVVAMGHSHGLRLVCEDGGLFINTGSHACGTRDYTLLDMNEGHVQCVRDGLLFQRAHLGSGGWMLDDLAEGESPWLALS